MGTTNESETYLRLTCERMIGGDPRRGWPQPGADVGVVARALKAAGDLEEDAVLAVVDEYDLAMSLRGGSGFRFLHSRGQEPRVDLSSQRVVFANFEVTVPGDQRMVIRKIVFTANNVAVQTRGPGSPPGGSNVLSGAPIPGVGARAQIVQPPPLALVDDQGTTVTASMRHWGSSGSGWEGTFHSDRPLSPQTAWIAVDGTPIVFPPQPPTADVKTEAVEPEDGITYGLQQEIASGPRERTSLEEFIAVLESIKAVDAETSAVADARRVAAALASGTAATGVGPPWDAVFRRSSRSDGPVGQIAMSGVATVEGCSIRFDSLTSTTDGFSVRLAASPASILPHPFPGSHLDPAPISWWAEDDRNNLYFGLPNGEGASDSVAEGTIMFTAPLDPAASSLRLLPTGRRERAVVTFALDWSGGRP
jgi:hypothetical protein